MKPPARGNGTWGRPLGHSTPALTGRGNEMPGLRITPTAGYRSGLPTGFCVNRPVYAAEIRLHFRRRVFPGAGQRVLAVQPRLAFPPNVVEAAFWTMGTGRHVGKRPEASAIDVDARGNCFARARAANHQLAHLCAT